MIRQQVIAKALLSAVLILMLIIGVDGPVRRNMMTLATTQVEARSGSPASKPAGQLVFHDEFSGTSLDAAAWTALTRSGDASNGEQQCYLPSNVTVSNGSLVIANRHDSTCADYGYSSGMVQSRIYNFTYGAFEVRARMPKGQGQWPALWLLGAKCQKSNVTSADNIGACRWPISGSNEIDLFEGKNSQTTTGFFNLLNGTEPNNANLSFGCGPELPFDTSIGYHTYGLSWQPGSLIWQIDGQTYCSTTNHVPSTPMFIMLNIAMGGFFTGHQIDNSVLPQRMFIDYVRVYQQRGSVHPTPASKSTATRTRR